MEKGSSLSATAAAGRSRRQKTFARPGLQVLSPDLARAIELSLAEAQGAAAAAPLTSLSTVKPPNGSRLKRTASAYSATSDSNGLVDGLASSSSAAQSGAAAFNASSGSGINPFGESDEAAAAVDEAGGATISRKRSRRSSMGLADLRVTFDMTTTTGDAQSGEGGSASNTSSAVASCSSAAETAMPGSLQYTACNNSSSSLPTAAAPAKAGTKRGRSSASSSSSAAAAAATEGDSASSSSAAAAETASMANVKGGGGKGRKSGAASAGAAGKGRGRAKSAPAAAAVDPESAATAPAAAKPRASTGGGGGGRKSLPKGTPAGQKSIRAMMMARVTTVGAGASTAVATSAASSSLSAADAAFGNAAGDAAKAAHQRVGVVSSDDLSFRSNSGPSNNNSSSSGAAAGALVAPIGSSSVRRGGSRQAGSSSSSSAAAALAMVTPAPAVASVLAGRQALTEPESGENELSFSSFNGGGVSAAVSGGAASSISRRRSRRLSYGAALDSHLGAASASSGATAVVSTAAAASSSSFSFHSDDKPFNASSASAVSRPLGAVASAMRRKSSAASGIGSSSSTAAPSASAIPDNVLVLDPKTPLPAGRRRSNSGGAAVAVGASSKRASSSAKGRAALGSSSSIAASSSLASAVAVAVANTGRKRKGGKTKQQQTLLSALQPLGTDTSSAHAAASTYDEDDDVLRYAPPDDSQVCGGDVIVDGEEDNVGEILMAAGAAVAPTFSVAAAAAPLLPALPRHHPLALPVLLSSQASDILPDSCSSQRFIDSQWQAVVAEVERDDEVEGVEIPPVAARAAADAPTSLGAVAAEESAAPLIRPFDDSQADAGDELLEPGADAIMEAGRPLGPAAPVATGAASSAAEEPVLRPFDDSQVADGDVVMSQPRAPVVSSAAVSADVSKVSSICFDGDEYEAAYSVIEDGVEEQEAEGDLEGDDDAAADGMFSDELIELPALPAAASATSTPSAAAASAGVNASIATSISSGAANALATSAFQLALGVVSARKEKDATSQRKPQLLSSSSSSVRKRSSPGSGPASALLGLTGGAAPRRLSSAQPQPLASAAAAAGPMRAAAAPSSSSSSSAAPIVVDLSQSTSSDESSLLHISAADLTANTTTSAAADVTAAASPASSVSRSPSPLPRATKRLRSAAAVRAIAIAAASSKVPAGTSSSSPIASPQWLTRHNTAAAAAAAAGLSTAAAAAQLGFYRASAGGIPPPPRGIRVFIAQHNANKVIEDRQIVAFDNSPLASEEGLDVSSEGVGGAGYAESTNSRRRAAAAVDDDENDIAIATHPHHRTPAPASFVFRQFGSNIGRQQQPASSSSAKGASYTPATAPASSSAGSMSPSNGFPRASLYGVADGHGGVAAANFVKENLPGMIFARTRNALTVEEVVQGMQEAFERCDRAFLNLVSRQVKEAAANSGSMTDKQVKDARSKLAKPGSCVVVTLLRPIHGVWMAFTANAGDSRAVIGRQVAPGTATSAASASSASASSAVQPPTSSSIASSFTEASAVVGPQLQAVYRHRLSEEVKQCSRMHSMMASAAAAVASEPSVNGVPLGALATDEDSAQSWLRAPSAASSSAAAAVAMGSTAYAATSSLTSDLTTSTTTRASALHWASEQVAAAVAAAQAQAQPQASSDASPAASHKRKSAVGGGGGGGISLGVFGTLAPPPLSRGYNPSGLQQQQPLSSVSSSSSSPLTSLLSLWWEATPISTSFPSSAAACASLLQAEPQSIDANLAYTREVHAVLRRSRDPDPVRLEVVPLKNPPQHRIDQTAGLAHAMARFRREQQEGSTPAVPARSVAQRQFNSAAGLTPAAQRYCDLYYDFLTGQLKSHTPLFLPRVAGSLIITRVIGDAYLKRADLSDSPYKQHLTSSPDQAYVSAVPEVRVRALTADDRFIVLGSDGLWDGPLSAQGVVELAGRFLQEEALLQRFRGALGASTVAAAASSSAGEEVSLSPFDFMGHSIAEFACHGPLARQAPSSSAPLRQASQFSDTQASSRSGGGGFFARQSSQLLTSESAGHSQPGLDWQPSQPSQISQPYAAAATSASSSNRGPTIATSLAGASDVFLGNPAERLVGYRLYNVYLNKIATKDGSGRSLQAAATGSADALARLHRFSGSIPLLASSSSNSSASTSQDGFERWLIDTAAGEARRMQHDDVTAIIVLLPSSQFPAPNSCGSAISTAASSSSAALSSDAASALKSSSPSAFGLTSLLPGQSLTYYEEDKEKLAEAVETGRQRHAEWVKALQQQQQAKAPVDKPDATPSLGLLRQRTAPPSFPSKASAAAVPQMVSSVAAAAASSPSFKQQRIGSARARQAVAAAAAEVASSASPGVLSVSQSKNSFNSVNNATSIDSAATSSSAVLNRPSGLSTSQAIPSSNSNNSNKQPIGGSAGSPSAPAALPSTGGAGASGSKPSSSSSSSQVSIATYFTSKASTKSLGVAKQPQPQAAAAVESSAVAPTAEKQCQEAADSIAAPLYLAPPVLPLAGAPSAPAPPIVPPAAVSKRLLSARCRKVDNDDDAIESEDENNDGPVSTGSRVGVSSLVLSGHASSSASSSAPASSSAAVVARGRQSTSAPSSLHLPSQQQLRAIVAHDHIGARASSAGSSSSSCGAAGRPPSSSGRGSSITGSVTPYLGGSIAKVAPQKPTASAGGFTLSFGRSSAALKPRDSNKQLPGGSSSAPAAGQGIGGCSGSGFVAAGKSALSLIRNEVTRPR